MSDMQRLLHLRFLYYQKMFGVKYVKNLNFQENQENINLPKNSLQDVVSHCVLCDRSKVAKPSFGILPLEAKIIFITLLPLVNSGGAFLENKSTKMFGDIIKNVFKLNSYEYGILSLVKCDENNLKISNEEIMICKRYLNEQITSSKASLIVLMGDSVLKHLFGLDFSTHSGRIFSQEGKKILATYALSDLLKNPSLKKDAMGHFLLAKGVL